MTFKTHLLIVSVIILAVYLVWDILRSAPPPTATQTNTAYSITVNHASWALNCPVYANGNNVLDKAYVKKQAPSSGAPKKDNALEIISGICNGTPECTLSLTDDVFPEMAPADCADKKLEVEYRCFSYDRPWHAEAMSSAATLLLSCHDKVSQ